MAYVERPDGARIYYEVHGQGFPVLLLAPGAINSQVSFWTVSTINPFDYGDEFQLIAMDQRHAQKSPGPLRAPTWGEHAADQIAVLDAAGAQEALVWGGCIGVTFALRLAQDAPGRLTGIVGQDVVGYYPGVNTRATFFAMFAPTIALAREAGMQAVVDAALANPTFMANNVAGPFAARIAADPAFRAEVLALDPAEYARIIHAWDDQLWGAAQPYMSVEESFVQRCPVPLLILPGGDDFHPPALAAQLCREAPDAVCLDAACRTPAQIAATRARIRAFLREHAQPNK